MKMHIDHIIRNNTRNTDNDVSKDSFWDTEDESMDIQLSEGPSPATSGAVTQGVIERRYPDRDRKPPDRYGEDVS